MIVVEGCDGAGKTTLVKTLLKDYPQLQLRPRMSTSLGGPVDYLATVVTEDLERTSLPTDLYDRHALISEPIYGPICRGHMKARFDDHNWFIRSWGKFLHKRPFIIFCLPPIGTVVSNVEDTHQHMNGVTENIDAIYWSYWTLAMRLLCGNHYSSPRIDIYDYTGSTWCNYTQIKEDLEGHLDRFAGVPRG